MEVPILKQGDYLIASIQTALTDAELMQLRDDLDRAGRHGTGRAASSSTSPRWT